MNGSIKGPLFDKKRGAVILNRYRGIERIMTDSHTESSRGYRFIC